MSRPPTLNHDIVALFAEIFESDYTVAISYPFLRASAVRSLPPRVVLILPAPPVILPALYTISLFVTLDAKQELNDALSQTHASHSSGSAARPASRSIKLPSMRGAGDLESNQSYMLSIQEVERSVSLDSR